MQSIDSIETYAYGIHKDLVREKEGIEYNKCDCDYSKQYNKIQKWFNLIMLKMKT